MKHQLRLFAVLAFCSSGSAFAQGAWDYVDLIRNETKVAKLDRWTDVGILCPDEVQGVYCVAFRLPKQLVGDRDVDVVLKGARERDQLSWTLSGPSGDAFCVQASTAVSCLIHLKDLALDATEIETYLTSTFTDPAQFRTAKTAAQNFRERPVLRWWHGFF